ncbi:putative SpoU family rRNA methylase [Bradyrhizobium sp. AZCC 2230]
MTRGLLIEGSKCGVSLKRVNRKLQLRVNAEMIVIAAPRLPREYPIRFDFTCSVGSLLTGEVRYVQGNSDCALGAPIPNDV